MLENGIIDLQCCMYGWRVCWNDAWLLMSIVVVINAFTFISFLLLLNSKNKKKIEKLLEKCL